LNSEKGVHQSLSSSFSQKKVKKIETSPSRDWSATTMQTKLSLNARKNLKEFEAERDTHLATIADVVGLSAVTLEADLAALSEALAARDASDKDLVGRIFYSRCEKCFFLIFSFPYHHDLRYLGSLAKNLAKHFAEETAKKNLHAAWTSGVLRIELRPVKAQTNKNHTESAIEGGTYVLYVDPARIGSNYISCGDYLLETLKDGTGLSAKAAQDVKENEAKKEEHLKKIASAFKLSAVTIEIDLVAYAEQVDKVGSTKKDRVGQQIYDWLLEKFSENMVALAKDDMTREAILEQWSTGKVCFRLDSKVKDHACDFEGGNLIVTSNPDRVCANHMSIGKDIEGKL
jgi:hypothetical protein